MLLGVPFIAYYTFNIRDHHMTSKTTTNCSFVKIEQPSGSALCQQLAQLVLDDFTDQMIEMINKSTHGLTTYDIRTFLTEYKTQSFITHTPAFKSHFQHCLNLREQELFDPRLLPFQRVLTMSFANLFPPEGALTDNTHYISRRILPGLFLALEKMVGSDLFQQGDEACHEVLNTTKDAKGIVIWEDLCAHPYVLDAMDDLLMRLVNHFENPLKRIRWMLTIINNDLADPNDVDFEGQANQDWQLDERGMINVLRHLFDNLRHRLTDQGDARALAQKYGQDTARQLVDLIKVLERTEA